MSRLLSLIRSHKLLSALLAGTVAADAAYYGLHNLAQSYRAYRTKQVSSQENSESVAISEELRAALREAGARLGIEADCANRVSLFVCNGVDPVRFGRLSANGRFEASLGLPEQFHYRPTDQKRHAFYFDNRPLSLKTKKGRELYNECLLLSEDERGFALARELAYLTSYAAHAPPVIFTVAASGLMITNYWLNYGSGQQLVKTLVKRKPNFEKIAVFGLVVVSGILWSLMAYQWHAAYRKSLDGRVDRRASAAYPLGGASFYRKQVRRNMLLRAMLGESVGKKYFTVGGNEVHNWVLSDPFLPVNQRWSKLRYDQSLSDRAQPNPS